ncbi:MAG: alpha/beta hydrolase [Sinimarinibacterium sp.]
MRTTILYHHLTGSCRIEGAALARVARARHVRVVAIDRPGFGGSSPHQDRTLADWPADALAVADELGIERFAVVGASGGAAHALTLAAAASARVSSVILAGPLPDKGHPAYGSQPWWLRALLPITLSPVLWKTLMDRFMRDPQRFVDRRLFMREYDQQLVADLYSDLYGKLLPEALKQGLDGLLQELRLLAQPWGIEWRAIRAPLHLYCGTSDMLVRFARGVAEREPQIHYAEFPGAQLASLSPRYCDAIAAAAVHDGQVLRARVAARVARR